MHSRCPARRVCSNLSGYIVQNYRVLTVQIAGTQAEMVISTRVDSIVQRVESERSELLFNVTG